MSNLTSKTSNGWTPSPAEYIEVNRHQRSRFEIDSHLLNFGHDPAEIEAVWQQLKRNRSKKRRKGWLLRREPLEFGFRIVLLGLSFITLLAISNWFIPTYWGALLYFKAIGSLFFAGIVLLALNICVLLDYKVNYPHKSFNFFWIMNVVIATVSCFLAFCCIFFIFVDEQNLVDVKEFGDKLYYADATIGDNDDYVFLRYRIVECNDIGIICKVVEKKSLAMDRGKVLSDYFIAFDPTTGKPAISANKD